MTNDVQRLLVRIEASNRKLERDMAKIVGTSDRAAKRMERGFARANKNISSSFTKLSRNGVATFQSLSRAGIAITGALGVREIARYADAWTKITNQLRAASEISGITAASFSDINDIATRTRSGVEDLGNLYARLLRAAGPLGKTQQEVALATELVAKAFKAGGAASSEQASGILQLGQALSSGFLQGDELRSLRENAPLVAQAIAREFETTIGGLKQLGADGELTADRVFDAILNSQKEFEAAFGVTNSTISEGVTLFRNALIELVSAFDAGSGASKGLSTGFAEISVFLRNSTEAAKRFGAQVGEAFYLFAESGDHARKQILSILEISKDAGFSISASFSKAFSVLISSLKGVVAVAVATGAAIGQAMLRAVDSVTTGGVAVVNAAVATVEFLLNKIVDGVQKLIEGINLVIDSANQIPGIEVPPLSVPLNFEFSRVTNPLPDTFKKGVVEVFKEKFKVVNDGFDDREAKAVGIYRRIRRAGETPNEANDPRGNQIAPDAPASDRGTKVKFDNPNDKKAAAKALKEEERLRREIQSIVDSTATADEKRAKKLEDLNSLRDKATAKFSQDDPLIGSLDQAINRFEKMSSVSNQIVDVLTTGMDGVLFRSANLKDTMRDIVRSLASSAFKQFISSAFLGTAPSGLAGAISGNIPGFARGTFSAPRGFGVVGENGPEIVDFRGGERVIPNNKLSLGNAVTLNIDASGSLDPQGTARAIKSALAPMVSQIARGEIANNQRRA